MKSITLPDELSIDTSLPIEVYEYKSLKEISKQQIVFSMNTFSFLREGTKEVFFDNSTFSIENTEFLLMKTGHCLMTEKLSNTNNYYESTLLFFKNESVLKFIRKYELEKLISGKSQSMYSFKYDSFIKRFVDSLLDITKLPKKAQKNILEVKFDEIMLYLVELRGTDFLYFLIENSDDKSQQFIQTVESNQLNKLTLKELAFLCNMSVSTFKREFEKYYQESPIKWFHDKRLDYAFHLMKDEHKRASDIYLEVGYENLSSFVQAYKAKFGTTPKQHLKTLSF